MSKTSQLPLPRSRYNYESVRAEIRTRVPEVKKGPRDPETWGVQKLVAARCNLTPASFNKRLRGLSEQLKVEHLGAIADFFNAPPGWPLIPWVQAEDMERAWRAHREAAPAVHPKGPRKKV
jgi:hypothetical protein